MVRPLPYMDVNEDFDAATFEKGVSNEWKTAFAARKKGGDVTRSNAHFSDDYAVAVVGGAIPKSMVPKPSNPKVRWAALKSASLSTAGMPAARHRVKGCYFPGISVYFMPITPSIQR